VGGVLQAVNLSRAVLLRACGSLVAPGVIQRWRDAAARGGGEVRAVRAPGLMATQVEASECHGGVVCMVQMCNFRLPINYRVEASIGNVKVLLLGGGPKCAARGSGTSWGGAVCGVGAAVRGGNCSPTAVNPSQRPVGHGQTGAAAWAGERPQAAPRESAEERPVR